MFSIFAFGSDFAAVNTYHIPDLHKLEAVLFRVVA